MPPDRKGIQQRLGGMFVGSVTRIEHMGIDPPRSLPRCARRMMPITRASTPMAATVSTVSRSDSPFDTDEPWH